MLTRPKALIVDKEAQRGLLNQELSALKLLLHTQQQVQ
jgi:hypothetical protein